jgi:hypothetical protein
MYVGQGSSQPIVQDSGPASGGPVGIGLSELDMIARGTGTAPYAGQGSGPYGTIDCKYDGPTTGQYHYLCLSPNAQGGALIAVGNGGGASAQGFNIIVNGATYAFPFVVGGIVGPATSVVNDAACWNNTTGTLLKDCGAFVTVGGNNTWTGTNNFTGPFQIGGTAESFPTSGNIVGTSDAQTLTNKSIAASQINSGTLPATVMPALTGDVTTSAGAVATTIANNAVTNAKAAQAVTNTVKGNPTSGTANVQDMAMPSCSASGNALQWLTSTGFQCGSVAGTSAGWGLTLTSTVFSVSTTQPPYGFDVPINLGLTASASASALTINLTGANGSAPSTSNPVSIPFRSTTLATGTPVWTAVTGALSIVVNSGATLGTSNSVAFRLWIFAEYNGGTPELGVATCSLASTAVMYPCANWETNRVTSTTITGLATSPGTLYATTGNSNDAVRIIGYCDFASGLATAGSWASACTTLQLMGPGIKKPGDTVQGPYAATATATATSTSSTKVEANPTVAITPSSTPNLIHVHSAGGGVALSATGACMATLSRGATYNAVTTGGTSAIANTVGNVIVTPMPLDALDAPGTASSVTYVPFVWSAGSYNCVWNQTTGSAAPVSYIEVYEIMGALEPTNDNAKPLSMVG